MNNLNNPIAMEQTTEIDKPASELDVCIHEVDSTMNRFWGLSGRLSAVLSRLTHDDIPELKEAGHFGELRYINLKYLDCFETMEKQIDRLEGLVG